MILNVYLREKQASQNSFKSFLILIRKVRIGYTQNKAEKIVKADNVQNFMEVCLKKGLF